VERYLLFFYWVNFLPVSWLTVESDQHQCQHKGGRKTIWPGSWEIGRWEHSVTILYMLMLLQHCNILA